MLAPLQLASLSTTIVDAIARHGLLAVFALMLLDALLPVGGELTMLYGGVLAAGVVAGADLSLLGLHPHDGLQAYLLVVTAGTLGSLLGALGGWLIGVRGGEPLLERHGRWLHLGPERMDKARAWFARFGARAVLLGRLTPLVRSFISVPAGVLRAPLRPYALLTLLGSAIWCAVFAAVGWAVSGSWETADHAFRYGDYAVAAAVAGAAALLVARARRGRRATPAGAAR